MIKLDVVSLLDLINSQSAVLAEDPQVQAAAKAIDDELRKVTKLIPSLALITRIRNRDITDHALLALLAWGFHVDFYDVTFSVPVKQELVAKSLDWHTRKGTPSAVEEVVSAVFSDAKVTEWFEYGGLPYTFKVSTALGGQVDNTAARELIQAIFSVKNTRSWLDGIETLKETEHEIYYGTAVIQQLTQHVGLK